MRKINMRQKCRTGGFVSSILASALWVSWGIAAETSASQTAETNDPFQSRCAKVIDVPISLREALPNFAEYGKVRRRAIDRAAEQAVEQVVGLEIASSREVKNALHNDVADSRYREEISGESAGLVRPRITSEELVKINDANFMELKFIINVCIPKTPDVPPKQIVGTPESFFNPLTGEPKVWFWRGNDGTIEFFDNEGFHPRTGDMLQPVTGDVIGEWRKREQERARLAAEKKVREEREAQAASRCDDLAASPNDVQLPSHIRGVEYALLKLNAAEAIDACRDAFKKTPTEGRYAYQLARALQAKGSRIKEAVQYLDIAIKRNHIAAYDNMGYALGRLGKKSNARAMFERGAAAGDPSSMVSLAWIYEVESKNGNYDILIQRAVNLYQKAARLGHPDAKRRLTELPQEIELRRMEAETKRRQQEQAIEIIGGVLGTILQNAGRN